MANLKFMNFQALKFSASIFSALCAVVFAFPASAALLYDGTHDLYVEHTYSDLNQCQETDFGKIASAQTVGQINVYLKAADDASEPVTCDVSASLSVDEGNGTPVIASASDVTITNGTGRYVALTVTEGGSVGGESIDGAQITITNCDLTAYPFAISYDSARAVSLMNCNMSEIPAYASAIDIDIYDEAQPVIVCGDGVIDEGEGCDDGDVEPLDGCSDVCAVESGYSCEGQPSICMESVATLDDVVAGASTELPNSILQILYTALPYVIGFVALFIVLRVILRLIRRNVKI